METERQYERRRTGDIVRSPNFINSDQVQTQVGLQNVRGSIYYGSVHYHSTSPGDHASDEETYFALSEKQQLEYQRKSRFANLVFDQLHIRHATIENAYQSTCQWFLQREEYVQWLGNPTDLTNRGMLWIKGKPGSGKSTLMKFLLGVVSEQVLNSNNDSTGSSGTFVVAFFFNARGSSLEKSALGAYRALLYQIIKQCPDLCTALDELMMMTISTLQAALNRVATGLGSRSLILFIDALDECEEEEEIHEMVNFFDDLAAMANASATRLRVCFSSRHFPNVIVKHGLSLVLEDQSQHSEDLLRFVQNKLNIGTSETAQKIRHKLLAKASGIFLWVKLVIQILNSRYRKGRLFELEDFLDHVPGQLEELFERILTKEDTSEEDDRKEFLLCLQWLLFSRRALSPIELYFAILVDTGSSLSPERKIENGTDSDIERYILSCSKGLVEVSKGDVRVIQFIHESVRTFLLQRIEIIGLGSTDDYAGVGHARLAECCSHYIGAIDMQLKNNSGEEKDYCDINKHFPLLSYATTYLLEHSNVAQKFGESQRKLLTELNADTLQTLAFIASKPYFPTSYQSDHLLYALAEGNYAALISLYCETCSSIEPESGRHRYPLLAAQNAKNEAALRALLTPSSSIAQTNALSSPPQECEMKDVEETVIFLLKSEVIPDTETPLTWAAKFGNLCMVRCLLNTGKVDVNLQSAQGVTPLFVASSYGHEQVVLSLVQHSARINETGTSGSALTAAAVNGHINIVNMLLDLRSGLETVFRKPRQSCSESLLEVGKTSHPSITVGNVKSGFSEHELAMALGAAARIGRTDILHLLLDAGADINHNLHGGENALHLATSAQHQHIVAFLLERGADPNVCSLLLGTPLHIACRNRHEQIIELLLDASADVNAPSDARGTPIEMSRRLWRPDIVRILTGSQGH